MRIIAGEFRSRKLLSPPEDVDTRPIPDRVKESVFGILRGNVEGAVVFDAFAGTGAIGLEALSRGAERCVFVERDKRMAEVLEANIATLRVGDRCEVVVGDALGPGALARCPSPVDLVFLDPPYPLMRDRLGSRRILEQVSALVGRLKAGGFLALRTPWPALYETDEPSGPPDPRPPKKTRRDRGARRSGPLRTGEWKQVWSIDEGPTGDRDLDAVDDEDEKPDAEQPGAAPAAKPKPEPIPLVVAGVLGPETHVYGSMAVHLYAPRPRPAGLA